MSTLSQLLLTVAAAHHLPGLGVLALPAAGPPQPWPYPLHTALLVRLVWPEGYQATAPATVEEVSRADHTLPALLVQLEQGPALVAGTQIWLVAPPTEELPQQCN
jgi:hypothetical protein